MKYSYRFFPYSTMDIQAAQDELNRLGAAGWKLDRLWLDEIARYLYKKETITGDEFMDILKKAEEKEVL